MFECLLNALAGVIGACVLFFAYFVKNLTMKNIEKKSEREKIILVSMFVGTIIFCQFIIAAMHKMVDTYTEGTLMEAFFLFAGAIGTIVYGFKKAKR